MEHNTFLHPPEERTLIAVGLDASLYLRAERKDVLTLAMAGGLGLALAFAGAVTTRFKRSTSPIMTSANSRSCVPALNLAPK